MDAPLLPRLLGTRYVVPLREGGSLPGVVDVEGEGTFVVKFRGAGQGPKALVAEALVALVGLALDLPVPRPAVVDLDAGFGRSEPDPEIQDVLRASVGANFGLDYLPGALAFDPSVDGPLLTPELAADIVWLDAYMTNVDRTPRNTNLLVSLERVWLIDHGAAVFVHHRWAGWQQRIHSPFPQIVDTIPEEWLGPEEEFATQSDQRAAYLTYLFERLNGPRAWLGEAIGARQRGPEPLGPRLTHRVV